MKNPRFDYDYSIHYRTWHSDDPDYVAKMIRSAFSFLKPYLPEMSVEPVLDIGCGFGFALEALKQHGFSNISGVDVDASQVAACQKRGLGVMKINSVVEFLENKLEKYAVIIMMDVLEHIPVEDQIQTMTAVHNALKLGGRVILQVPNASSIVASRRRYGDYTHFCSFTEHSLRYVLKNAGFDAITIPGPKPLKRGSMRLWHQENRRDLRMWIIRWIWRQVLIAFFSSCDDIETIPTDPDFVAMAMKNRAPNGKQ